MNEKTSNPPVIRDHEDSEAIRTRQLHWVEEFQKAAGNSNINIQGYALFPPPALVEAVNQAWYRKAANGLPSHRGIFIDRVFEAKEPWRDRNIFPEYDLEIPRIAKGIIDEYLLCYYWETLLKKGASSEERRPVSACVEAAKSSVAAHYVELFQERGYTSQQAVKTVGKSIDAFLDSMRSIGIYPPNIQPTYVRGCDPDQYISEIHHERMDAERMANNAIKK